VVVLEGHVRLTAFMLACDRLPPADLSRLTATVTATGAATSALRQP
jgi:hypothetical protein